MSKKAFSSDLDSVFAPGAQYEPNIDSSPWLTGTTAEVAAPEAPVAPESRARARSAGAPARRSSRKSFDLDSLFRAATAERPEADARPAEDPTARQRARPRRGLPALAGIDALIRDTTEGRAIAREDARVAEERQAGVPKRVTFTYDRDRFARLKEIAREEGAYLKDIISGLLNDYVSEYEAQTR